MLKSSLRILLITLLAFALVRLTACTDAQVASSNLSKAADSFEIDRRVVFYDSRQGEYLLMLEGRCSVEKDPNKGQLAVTCKVGPNEFKKHFLGVSDSVTYFVEQLAPVAASVYRYRVVFKPEAIVPAVDLSVSGVQKQ
jgi:hypothetical protein